MPAFVERSRKRHAWIQRGIDNTVRVLFLVLLLLTGFGSTAEVQCLRIGKYRVCELNEPMLAPPFEVGDEVDRNFSSPSKKLLQQLRTFGNEKASVVGAMENRSVFEAEITGSASSEQREAVQFCMDRAAENWVSAVPVKVLVKFEDLGVPNLLGAAQPSRNWILRDYICPVALAEAVLGQDLNSGANLEEQRFDIWMTLNSDARWYTGTDARAPFGRYDLVTVCLHETYHGLFMSGGNIGVNAEADGSYRGFFYNSRYRGRFDSFMANQDECQIVGYGSDEKKLGAVLTGNNLWFAEGERRVGRLHAPRPYTVGSSLYHLSEWEYGEGTDDNDLMTPAIGSNYGQHNVGNVLLELQKLVRDIEGKSGAKVCEVLRDPEEDDGLINQGSGGADRGDGDEKNNNTEGFKIKIGNTDVSGWVFVGAAVGAVVLIGVLVGLIVRGSLVEKRKVAATRSERKRRRAEHRIDFENGNGGGVV